MFFRRRKAPDVPPVFAGSLDQFSNGTLQGWVCSVLHQDECVHVEVHLRGERLRREPANQERPDVNAAGIAGPHGYRILLPPLPSIDRGDLAVTAECRGETQTILTDAIEEQILDFYAQAPEGRAVERCTTIWGSDLERERISAKTYEDAVYLPFNSGILLDHDPYWGLYKSDGSLINGAAYRRGANLDLVGQSEVLDLGRYDLDEAPFETMVYGGPLLSHYGHFLLSTLSRCWAIDGSHPVLFHSTPPVQAHRARFIVEMLGLTGLAGRSFSFERPTRIRRVIVPGPSLYEQHSIWRDHAVAMSAIARGIGSGSDRRWQKVYFSKSRLGAGVNGLEGEAFIDLKMKQAGFEIVYPEMLTVAEQVAIFRTAELIVGLAGSAFHTLTLAPQTQAKRVIFTFEGFLNSNFLLIDRVSGGNAEYYTLKDEVSRTDTGLFTMNYAVRNANRLADQIIALSSGRPRG
ncbi:glycosyltransferase 61 family protein [Methylobacterium sp. AMS5]|uniref:glycosyltransferase family 61 protein n=1 Tax=Methylobacterium sp. AMS5 TaxID=925818 RepID=UPI00074F8674|nr:glycosyltransferase 61 family protein [Methylobacterium sp. AMS5]AMB47139.1 hypothetical protein Y590_19540 [Methylobacterium sp. AMS5]